MRAFLKTILAVLGGLLVVGPSATAWTLPDPRTTSVPPNIAAWTLFGEALPFGSPDPTGAASGAMACALGDVNHDGVSDLLVRVRDVPNGPSKLKALAGPDFKNTVWQVATKGERVLRCAPDLDLDGAADPVTSLASHAASSTGTAGPVADQATDQAMQVVDGATGQAVMQRQHKDTQTTAGAGAAGVQSAATANLMPAVGGAEAFVQTEVQRSALSAVPSGLPVSSLTATARHTAEMQLLNAQGTVQGTIKIDQPGVDPLALAPLPMGKGLPDVAALTQQAAGPVQEATARIPTLSLYNPDGSLAWAVKLNGTQGLPLLVPRAGDLNLDGVQDIIVETATYGVQATASSQFQVLSGIDGKALLQSGVPVNGLMAALPLGPLADGVPAILSAAQAQGAAKLTLKAVNASGTVAWTADLEPGSIPLNVRLDAYTHDPLGFTDLTGDGVPDVGVAVAKAGGLLVQAINGTNGNVSWSATLPNVDRVIPVSPFSTLATLSSTVPNVPSDLLAVGNASAGLNLSLVQGKTGKVVWTVKGALPTGATKTQVDVQAAGDLNKDGVQDLVAAATSTATSGGAEAKAIYAVSGATGATLWSNATDPAQTSAVVSLTAEKGPAFAEQAAALGITTKGGSSPAIDLAVAMPSLAAVAWTLRRRKDT